MTRALFVFAALILGGVTAVGCVRRPPPPPGPQTPVATPGGITGMPASDAIDELKRLLSAARAPRIIRVHEVSPTRYRYRFQELIVVTRDKTVRTDEITHVTVEKPPWVFVYDRRRRHADKIKCADPPTAERLKALIEYICTPEFRQSYDDERAANAPPPPPAPAPAPAPPPADLEPCAICAEPRGDAPVCPACGMN